jgi:hypothetical protein
MLNFLEKEKGRRGRRGDKDFSPLLLLFLFPSSHPYAQ